MPAESWPHIDHTLRRSMLSRPLKHPPVRALPAGGVQSAGNPLHGSYRHVLLSLGPVIQATVSTTTSGFPLGRQTSRCEGCVLFKPNPQKPPPEEDLPVAISEVMQKWMLSQPVRLRETLPVVQNGNMVGLFVWFDRAGP